MYFPIAGIEVSPWLPPLVAFSISFFTSMGGVSGAFLLLPFQVSVLGFTSPSVSATNQVFNIVAIPSGVYRYIREGRMVWPLTWVVIIGTLPGVLIGAMLRISYLPNPKNFKLFAGLVLLYIGGRLLRDLLKKKQGQGGKASAEEQFQKVVREYQQRNIARSASGKEELPRVAVKKFSLTRIVYEFYGQTFDINAMGIMALSFIVGIVGGVYGIGGRGHHRPVFRQLFRPAGLYRGRCGPDGHLCHLGGRGGILPDDRPLSSRHGHCPRLAAGLPVRVRGFCRHVLRGKTAEIRAGQSDQVDTDLLHPGAGPALYLGIF